MPRLFSTTSATERDGHGARDPLLVKSQTLNARLSTRAGLQVQQPARRGQGAPASFSRTSTRHPRWL